MDTSRLLLTIIKKTKTKQAFQVNDVNAFLHMARYKSLSSLKLFLWYASLILGPCYLVFSILNPLRVQHQVPMASWLATFIVYQSVRQHFSSARTNFHHFFQYKNICFLGIFQDFCFFFFFFLIIFIFSIYCTMEILFSLSFSVLVFLEIYMSFSIIFFRTTQERNW